MRSLQYCGIFLTESRMPAIRILLLVSTLWVCKAYADVDSAGTDFLTIIPWNNNDVNTFPTANLDLINADPTGTATVQLSYSVYSIIGEDIATSVRRATVTVTPASSSRYTFSGDSIYQYVTQGLNTDYPSTKIFIHSDIPITAFVHNYANDGAGDTFAVLPTSMAAKEYSFSLPAPATANGGLSMIYLLPTIADVNIKFTVITASSRREYTAAVSAAPTAKVVIFGGPPKDFTFYASGDNPFVIVSGVRKLPTLTASDIQDFGSFMPLPPTSTNCAEHSVNDYHFTDLSSANYFTMTSPGQTCANFQITALGPGSNYSNGIFINPGRVHSPMQFSNATYGGILILRSQDARVEMVRYGGYGLSTGQGKGEGAFLDNLPSRDQFVTGTTPYISYGGYDQITVFGDEKTRKSATSDGMPVQAGSWQPQLYDGNVVYYTVASVQNGIHFFSASGTYTIHVSGSVNNHARGFTPRIMWQGTPASPPTGWPETSSTSTASTPATPSTQLSKTSSTSTASTPATPSTQLSTSHTAGTSIIPKTTAGAITLTLSFPVLLVACFSVVCMQ